MSQARTVPDHSPEPRPASYREDVFAWAMEQARLIRAGRFEVLDRENVAEEIESVGRSVRSELRSRVGTVVEHLLKLEGSSAVEPRRGWTATVRRSRLAVEDLLDEAPSLRRELPAMLREQMTRTGQLVIEQLQDADESAETVRARLGSGGFTAEEVFGDWLP